MDTHVSEGQQVQPGKDEGEAGHVLHDEDTAAGVFQKPGPDASGAPGDFEDGVSKDPPEVFLKPTGLFEGFSFLYPNRHRKERECC